MVEQYSAQSVVEQYSAHGNTWNFIFSQIFLFFTRYLLQVSGPNKTTITNLVSSKNHKYTNFLNL